jgi:hypothetical protein
VEITRDDARCLVAIEHGFTSWDALRSFTESPAAPSRRAAKPAGLSRLHPQPDADVRESARTIASSRDWDAVIRLLAFIRPHASRPAVK